MKNLCALAKLQRFGLPGVILLALISQPRIHSDQNLATSPTEQIHFGSSAPSASPAELRRRLGISSIPADYNIAEEEFRLVIPADYTNSSWGLIVWVSPGGEPNVPRAWIAEFARKKLLLISPHRAGNDRNAIDRCRLAVDAAWNMIRRYPIDPKRVYVAGFSGGGRIASILGVAYADVFSGCLAICGADFYTDLLSGPGRNYPATYRPDRRTLFRARDACRFVLLTGEADPNRDNTKAVAERGFRRHGFKHVRYIEVKGMKHALPSAGIIVETLGFLDHSAGPPLRQ